MKDGPSVLVAGSSALRAPWKPTVPKLLGDLAHERDALRRVVLGLDPERWARPASAGWTVRDQIAHLAFYDDMAALSIRDSEAFALRKREALADIPGFEARHLAAFPSEGPSTLAAWEVAAARLTTAIEQADLKARVPWFGPDMSVLSMITGRLMETWAHGSDAASALGTTLPTTDRLRHVATLAVRARAQGYAVRGRPAPAEEVRVDLTAPSGESWEFGPRDAPARIAGPAEDFCLVLTRRRHVDDTDLRWRGSAAREWLEIGQAFAGPPGPEMLRRNTNPAKAR